MKALILYSWWGSWTKAWRVMSVLGEFELRRNPGLGSLVSPPPPTAACNLSLTTPLGPFDSTIVPSQYPNLLVDSKNAQFTRFWG